MLARFAVATVLLTLSASTALADNAVVVVGGKADDHDRAQVGKAAEDALRASGWTLGKTPSKKDSDALLRCQDVKTPSACLPSAATAAFIFNVDAGQTESGVKLITIAGRFITTQPQSFVFQQRFCERCADDALQQSGRDVAQAIVDELAARSGHTVVTITSVPPAADIILDDKRLGPTDASFNTYPGNHTARLEKPGYISETRSFRVDAGKTATLNFQLKPSEAINSGVSTARSAPSRVLPTALLGVGGAFAIFAGISIYEGQRSGKYDYTRATTAGVVSGVLGLGAIGGGLYILLRTPDQPSPHAKTAIVGWSRQF